MNPAPEPLRWPRSLVVLLMTMIVAAVFVGNADVSVWDEDEAAYAGFALDMLENGNWIVPAFPHAQPHRKVPLTFWLVAGSYAIFGVNEFALRLPSALSILATIACVAYGARFLVGRRAALLSALILGSMPFVLSLGKIALTDGVLLLCETAAALAMLRGAVRPSWKVTATLWTAVALGVLAKGPPILVLVGAMFVFLLIVHRRRRNLVHLHPWLGLPLALVPLCTWVVIAWQADQRYVLFLGYWYILRRMGGGVFNQSGPPGTYLLAFFALLVPWSGYLLASLAHGWRRLRRRRLAFVLLGAWLFGGWIVWELLPSKLPTYPLGAFPALALLVGHMLTKPGPAAAKWSTHRSLRIGFYVLAAACFALGIAAIVIAFAAGARHTRWLSVLPAIAAPTVGWLAIRYQRRDAQPAAVRTLLVGALAAHILFWSIIIPGIDARRAVTEEIAGYIRRSYDAGTPILIAHDECPPSLPLHLRRKGMAYTEALTPADDRGDVRVDWKLLWQLRFEELVAMVKAQNPQQPPDTETDRLRLERVREAYDPGRPLVLVLDESQYEALHDALPGARFVSFDGWQSDRLQHERWWIAVSPATIAHGE